ncbi:50S ribosomal protein L13 [Candidatus Dependentiae bacterium]|nr:50S ribosomal protein L13 [Candidatus Dependentiae bacterium]
MNKAYFLRKEDQSPRWRVIDAQDQIVGRLATQIADALRGKDRANYTPHSDAGDYVVVLNAKGLKLSGNKMDQKIYETYSGWIGNKKYITAKQKMAKNPAEIIELAVKGMLPKTKLARQLLRKLRVYVGAEHPHAAQIAGFAE